ncbi:MAG: hypothetical protein HKN94_08195 [Acidimicrobiales bacterium]|nr:hypothetical protein [Acidimicrobiales bacterium]RZV48497.1 MAG: tetratricopeptide repeat protein [Acidimicrobiales bacterium]
MEIDLRRDRTVAALSAADRGDFKAASGYVVDLVADDPMGSHGHRTWGRVLVADNRLADAVVAFETAVEMDPDDAELRFELASALVYEGRADSFPRSSVWVEAMAAVHAGLEREPNSEQGQRILRVIEAERV